MNTNFALNGKIYEVTQLTAMSQHKVTYVSNLINWKLITFDPETQVLKYVNPSEMKELINNFKRVRTTIEKPTPWWTQLKNEFIQTMAIIFGVLIAVLIFTKLLSIVAYYFKKPVVAVTLIPREDHRLDYENNLNGTNDVPLSQLY